MSRTRSKKEGKKANQQQAGPSDASAGPSKTSAKKQRRKARLLATQEAGVPLASAVKKARKQEKKERRRSRTGKTEYVHHDPPVPGTPPPKRKAAAAAEGLIKDELASRPDLHGQSVGREGPSKKYWAVCSRPALPLEVPQRLLLVVDLNETLVLRLPRDVKPHPVCAKPRPYLPTFLRWLGKIDSDLLIWSSAAKHNVDKLAVPLGYPPTGSEPWTADLPRLAGVWSRADFGLTKEEYAADVATRKDLAKVWKRINRTGTQWSALNTVLLDNEAHKAALQPHSHVAVPTLTLDLLEADDALLGVIGILDTLRRFDNVPSAVSSGALGFDARAAVERGVAACAQAGVAVEKGHVGSTYVEGQRLPDGEAANREVRLKAMEELRRKGDGALGRRAAKKGTV